MPSPRAIDQNDARILSALIGATRATTSGHAFTGTLDVIDPALDDTS